MLEDERKKKEAEREEYLKREIDERKKRESIARKASEEKNVVNENSASTLKEIGDLKNEIIKLTSSLREWKQ
jgi:hypothetical protein